MDASEIARARASLDKARGSNGAAVPSLVRLGTMLVNEVERMSKVEAENAVLKRQLRNQRGFIKGVARNINDYLKGEEDE